MSDQYKMKGKNLFMPIRIFTSLQERGPELAKVIYLLGKEQVISNITKLQLQNYNKNNEITLNDS